MARKMGFNRIKFVRLITVLCFMVIFGRVSWIQAVSAEDLSKRAVEKRTTQRDIQPKRGNIYDATGQVLATSLAAKIVFVEPKLYQDRLDKLKNSDDKKKLQENIAQLTKILELDLSEVQGKFDSNQVYIPLARQVDLTKFKEIQVLDIPGVGFAEDSKRTFPMNGLASSVIGVVNLDGDGAEGLELVYNLDLFGVRGLVSAETDARARSLMGGMHSYLPPVEGNNLVLTIDSNIQYVAEQQLDEIMKKSEPLSAIVVVMEPSTGKVLAMASRPSFDPNNYRKFSPELRRNLGITMQYEPGSTFKVITGSAALEEGTTALNKVYNDPGYLYVDKQRITNWDAGINAPGSATFAAGMEQSSNVVMGQVGLELNRETFFKYIRGFGFGQATGIDLPGEATGTLLKEQKTSRFEQATMSFGQANAITPLQLLSAVCAIGNGGFLYEPYVVDKITDTEGKTVKQHNPVLMRQVISKTTSDQMKQVLERIVVSGTGSLAKIPGYRVGGKTGTAQKVDETGQYSDKKFIASFVGLAPIDDPKIAAVVIIDSPGKGGYHGGEVAAPVFQVIVQRSLAYMNVPPTDAPKGAPMEVNPQPAQQKAKTITPERKPNPGECVVPDLTGRTMTETGEILSKLGLRMNFSGTGLAVSQNYTPGKVVIKGTIIEVKFAS